MALAGRWKIGILRLRTGPGMAPVLGSNETSSSGQRFDPNSPPDAAGMESDEGQIHGLFPFILFLSRLHFVRVYSHLRRVSTLRAPTLDDLVAILLGEPGRRVRRIGRDFGSPLQSFPGYPEIE